ncbi:MAG: N-acetyltransferase family protein [Dongiaceae bacterium]
MSETAEIPQPEERPEQRIVELRAYQVATNLQDFVALLTDAVSAGGSIGFHWPMADGEAEAYWRDVIAAMRGGGRHLLAAYEGGQLLGTVQLDLAAKANARHRAEVQKLLVLQHARRRGLGRRLMRAAEELALRLGRTLLVLDVRKDDPAQRLYESFGFKVTGVVPRYAGDPDGKLCDCTFLYRELAAS